MAETEIETEQTSVERETTLDDRSRARLGGDLRSRTSSPSGSPRRSSSIRSRAPPPASSSTATSGTARSARSRKAVASRFTWRAPEEPATLVELTLDPLTEDGPVRLTVVETAPAGVPVPTASARAWPGRLQGAGGTAARVHALA